MENFTPTPERAETPTRSRWSRKTLLSLILLACAVSVGSFYAANVFLFKQTFPSYSSASGIVANCVTLSNSGAATPVGLIEYNCGPGLYAFTVTNAGTYVPTFLLPAGYTNLYLTTVASCGSLTQLNSTTAMTLSAISYVYCARYNTVGTLQSFNVTWTA